jgi:hypothetical protein
LDAYHDRVDASDLLRAVVQKKAKDMKAQFEFDHLNERTAGEALGFDSAYEGRGRLRDFVNRGLLRRVESPREPRVEESFDGTATEVESPWPLCSGGPFFLREDVMALRKEAILIANEKLRSAPKPVQQEAQVIPDRVLLAALLRAFIEQTRKGPPPT